MRILHLDIETAPNLAHVWGIWQQNVGLNQIIEDGYVLCWSAKWDGNPEVIYSGLNEASPKKMLQEIWNLLNEADVVVHYNGIKFDIPTLNSEFISHGLLPPMPYKQVDLLRVVKSKFRFPSNKLAYVSKRLGIGEKVKHVGHELWIGCMLNDPACWKIMKEYNIRDTVLLETLYHKLMPWITNHPVRALYEDRDEAVCRCGESGDNIIRQGYAYTNVGKYQQYQCKKCGSWFRGRNNVADRDNIIRNVI